MISTQVDALAPAERARREGRVRCDGRGRAASPRRLRDDAGAGDGDDEVANHWNARGTQAAFRTAGTALAAGARTARPLPAFGVLGVSSKTTRAELRALSKLVDGLPAACAEKAVAALLARCDCVRAVATTLDALAATPPSRLYRWSSALIGLVTPETVQPVVDDWSPPPPRSPRTPGRRSRRRRRRGSLDGTRLAAWADASAARKRRPRPRRRGAGDAPRGASADHPFVCHACCHVFKKGKSPQSNLDPENRIPFP